MPKNVQVKHKERLDAKTAATMIGMAGFSYFGERHGWMNSWPQGLHTAGNSIAHPLLGYVGAYAGAVLSCQHLEAYPRKLKAAAAATVLNFTVEFTQMAMSPPIAHNNFLAAPNRFETSKDYVFALAGTAIYFWQTRAKQERPFNWATDAPEIAR